MASRKIPDYIPRVQADVEFYEIADSSYNYSIGNNFFVYITVSRKDKLPSTIGIRKKIEVIYGKDMKELYYKYQRLVSRRLWKTDRTWLMAYAMAAELSKPYLGGNDAET